MKEKFHTKELIARFGQTGSFTSNNAFDFYNALEPGIKKSTVNWRVYHLVHQGAMQRTGRGVYSVSRKADFAPVPGRLEKSVAREISKKFPFIKYCVWHTSLLQEFYHHSAKVNFLVVEVEREAVDAVFYYLREHRKNTFKDPDKALVEGYVIDVKNAVIVKTLITEAPVQDIKGIPMPFLEKILVDTYADEELFSFLAGNEFLHVVKNALERYAVNHDRLLRYAARRGKREQLERILNQISGNF